MEDFLKLAELLGLHVTGPVLSLTVIAILWKRNLELQRKLFKLAHAQVLALVKLESTLEATTDALRRCERDRRDESVRRAESIRRAGRGPRPDDFNT